MKNAIRQNGIAVSDRPDSWPEATEPGARTRTDDGPLDLNTFLPYRLSVISFRVGQEIATLYRTRFRLQQQEWKVMSIIASHGSLRSTELTKHGTLDRVTVSRVLARLARRHLIQRRLHPRDRRIYDVTLSARGLAMYRVIAQAARKKEADITATLTAAEQKALYRILSKLDGYFDRRET